MARQVKIDRSDVDRLLLDLKELPKEIVDDAGDYYKSITPRKSGNAQRRTHTRGNTIVSDYPYAHRLDNGYSNQAPNGMTDPTIEYVKRILNNKLRSL